MPELPDVVVYLEALDRFVVGRELRRCEVAGTQRLGKRLVLALDGPDFVIPKRIAASVAAFDFDHGTLLLTEAGKRKKASLWLVRGADALIENHDRGGAEPLDVDLAGFRDALTARNRTLKRVLCDPTAFSGGNAYSDEILLAAGLSPMQRTADLDDGQIARLYEATRTTLTDWTERHRRAVGDGFPDKVTAFHDDMAVHG